VFRGVVWQFVFPAREVPMSHEQSVLSQEHATRTAIDIFTVRDGKITAKLAYVKG